MSFSWEVKLELAERFPEARHCQLAELSAFIHLFGKIRAGFGRKYLRIESEQYQSARKIAVLLERAFHFLPEVCIKRNGKKVHYLLLIKNPEIVDNLIHSLGLIVDKTNKTGFKTGPKAILIKRDCCKRAYLRGVFIGAGSVTDPEKNYHLEMVLPSAQWAEDIVNIFRFFAVEGKVAYRRGNYMVYVKDGEQIVDVLNVLGAHGALFNLENVRIIKDVRNSVNRIVNCETANINKIVNAASRQLEDIQWIIDTGYFQKLPENLQEIASVRLQYPDVSLKELGQLLTPAIGKSGVNHRLRKIGEIAEKMRENHR